MRKLIAFLFYIGLSLSGQAQSPADTCFIYVPNMLSGSGDCFDCDKLRIGSDCDFTEFKFRLFDRWGNLIFETTDPAFEYEPDGVKEGTYFYWIDSKTKNGSPKAQQGSISILR